MCVSMVDSGCRWTCPSGGQALYIYSVRLCFLEPAESHVGCSLFWWGFVLYLFGVGHGHGHGPSKTTCLGCTC